MDGKIAFEEHFNLLQWATFFSTDTQPDTALQMASPAPR
jgi:hypothetical protein